MKEIYPVFERIKSKNAKEKILNQKAKVIWFTGLSGSGKTTVAAALEAELFKQGFFCQMLDGDNIRSGINNNLSFTKQDRYENIRRIAEVAKLFLDCGIITICSFISPTNKIRNMAAEVIGNEDFLLINVNTPLEICEKRDIKGLYKKARSGEIKNFTGISSPFEQPENSAVSIDTSEESLEQSIEKILDVIIPQIKYSAES